MDQTLRSEVPIPCERPCGLVIRRIPGRLGCGPPLIRKGVVITDFLGPMAPSIALRLQQGGIVSIKQREQTKRQQGEEDEDGGEEHGGRGVESVRSVR